MNISGVNFTGGFVVSPAVDDQFNYVTALLHGDGANAGQNNTFLDSSTNNFAITRTGNVTQGSYSPYGSNWSNFFTGSSYLTAGTTASNFLCTGSATGITATLEAWVYPTAYITGGLVYNFSSVHSKGATYFNFGVRNGAVRFYWFDGATQKNVDSASTSDVPLNTWTHIVVTISGTTIKIYINGTLNTTSATYTGVAVAGLNQSENIGIEGTTTYFSGYISNYRLTSTVVYSASFTPPTAPLTAITGTALLICQSNRFKDNSTNNFAITVSGTPSVQPSFSPFGATIQYNPAVNGGSGYFNASTDYLTAPNTAAQFGSSNWTVEGWVYLNSVGSVYHVLACYGYNSATTRSWIIYIDLGGTLRLAQSTTGSDNFDAGFGTPTFAARTWYYVAVVRNGATITAYQNGVALSSTQTAQTLFTSSAAFTIGSDLTNYLSGYISDLRVVKGTAVYTTNFTPPTIPVTSITNTSLLLNYTNAQIFGSAMTNNFITVGNAQVSTSIFKYGTGSLYFDGTGDWLVPTNLLPLGSGDFTVEMWLYPNATYSGTYAGLLDSRTSADGAGLVYFGYTGTANQIGWKDNTTFVVTGTVTVSTWNHVAIVRRSGTMTMYINGTSTSSAANSTNYTVAFRLIGSSFDPFSLNGYIDELRLTNGIARYTANFTPPTSQFPSTGPIPIYPPTVEYLVVAGGGAGGGRHGGGGGAGGLLQGTASSGTSFTITVGAGAATATGGARGGVGINSSLVNSSATITAYGGGGGGVYPTPNDTGLSGGSGGGGGSDGASSAGGSASPAGQGNAGGSGVGNQPGDARICGGGGGAGAVGANGSYTLSTPGNGGVGVLWSDGYYYAGGGGGGNWSTTINAGNGGLGGGGGGGAQSAGGGAIGLAGTGGGSARNSGTAGTRSTAGSGDSSGGAGGANTGGGGGGAGQSQYQSYTGTGGAGGSGTVIIRYPTTFSLASSTTGNPTITTTGGYNIYTWTSSGSITF
jgi:hypothetical protein